MEYTEYMFIDALISGDMDTVWHIISICVFLPLLIGSIFVLLFIAYLYLME